MTILFLMDPYELIKNDELSFLDKFEMLRVKTDEYRNKLEQSFPIDKEVEMRYRFFNLMYKLLIFYDVNIMFHSNYLIRPNILNQLIPYTSNADAHVISNDYVTFNNKNLIYTTTSFIETLFRSILRSLTGEYYTEAFWKAKRDVFELADIGQDSNFWLAITILFHVRNGIHNNGLHISAQEKSQSIRVVYREKAYRFEQGFPMMGYDYNTIYNTINDILDGVVQLCESTKIKNIAVIEDIGTVKWNFN